MNCQHLVRDRDALGALISGRKAHEFPQTNLAELRRFEQSDLREFNMTQLLDEAIALGYWWAKFETQRDINPLAALGLERKRSASIGGKISGKVRRDKARSSWQELVFADVKSLRSKNPSWSQDKLASEIVFRHDDSVPGIRTIKTFISNLERSGEIPGRK
jgi:hypothetical protein